MTSLSCSKHKVICGVQWQEVPCTLYCVQQPLLVLGSGTISPNTVEVSILGEETSLTYEAALSSAHPAALAN